MVIFKSVTKLGFRAGTGTGLVPEIFCDIASMKLPSKTKTCPWSLQPISCVAAAAQRKQRSAHFPMVSMEAKAKSNDRTIELLRLRGKTHQKRISHDFSLHFITYREKQIRVSPIPGNDHQGSIPLRRRLPSWLGWWFHLCPANLLVSCFKCLCLFKSYSCNIDGLSGEVETSVDPNCHRNWWLSMLQTTSTL